MEKFNRAVRRHHTKRLKAKRKAYWGYGTPYHQIENLVFIGLGKGWTNRLMCRRGLHYPNPTQLGKLVQYPQACSCLGCSGNYERRYFGRKTLKEVLFTLSYDEQLKEL